MLIPFQLFIKKYGARSSMFLHSAPVTFIDDVALPRSSIVHDLEMTTERLFPVREGYINNGTARSKRILIHQLEDFEVEVHGAKVIAERALPIKARKWIMSNTREFRKQDLLTMPFKDTTSHGLINYNLLKAKYEYKESLYSHYNRHANLQRQFVKTLIEAIDASGSGVNHIVQVELPSAVPSYNVFKRFQNLKLERLQRVIRDPLFRTLFDWYAWLNRETRERISLYNDITEEHANQVLLMFKYKGYVTFVPLSVLLSMSTENDMKSSIKFGPERLQRFFIVFVLKLQAKIDALLEENKESDDEIKVIDPERDTGNDDLDESKPLPTPTPSDDDEGLDSSAIELDLDQIESMDEDDFDYENQIKVMGLSKFNDLDNDEDYGSKLIDDLFNQDIDRTDDNIEQIASYDDHYFTRGQDTVLEKIKDLTPNGRFNKELEQLYVSKSISAAEHRQLLKAFNTRQEMTNPYGGNELVNDFTNVDVSDVVLPKEQTKIPVTSVVVPDSFKQASLNTFDSKYIKDVMRKDIVAAVMHLENNGVIVKKYEIEESQPSALGQYELHRVTFKPIRGAESTVFFKVPKIDNNGEFYANGVKQRLRKQRTEVPIKKVSPIRVALTSSYTKLFINRSERKQFDPYTYLTDFIRKSFMEEADDRLITKLVLAPVYKSNQRIPYILGHLAQSYSHFSFKDINVVLDLEEAKGQVKDEVVLANLAAQELYPCGIKGKKLLVCDMDNVFHVYHSSEKQEPLGTLHQLFEIPNNKLPKPFSHIRILGKVVPLGVVLAFYLGISDLLRLLKVVPMVLPANKRVVLKDNQWRLRFSDIQLIFTNLSEEQTLLLGGFLFYEKFIKDHPYDDFNFENIYLLLLEFRGLQIVHLKEIGLLRDIFLDPITKNVLEAMNEPTEYIPLLLKANQMLTDVSHPELTDANYTRIRGYDRVPSLIYRNLASSIRAYRFRSGVRTKVELDPYAVWNAITQDNTTKIIEDTNPVMNLKEQEAVTLLGMDGLSKETIAVMQRNFTENDMGLISELTVDSGDVGINTFLTTDPKLGSLRGTVNRDNNDHISEPSKLLSTSALLAPGSDTDD